MNCERFDQAIGDYVDGTLGPSAHAADGVTLDALEAHLASCARCRALVDDFRTIREAASRLEPHPLPSGLWHRIAADIDDRSRQTWLGSALSGWPSLAAAAVLMAIVGVGAWLAMQPATTPQTADAGAIDAPAQAEPIEWADAERMTAEAQYVQAIAGLEEITDAAADTLDPGTTEILQANLTVIDDAIDESRAALETEPTSDLAQESLFEALRVKVALLQDTLALINEMRQGDPAGTARIVTELNQ